VANKIHLTVDFGDCDPAGIVFYPNFYRWFDRATHALARSAGLSMAQLKAERGWICWPLVDTGAKFISPAAPGDELTVETDISEWGRKTFRLRHIIKHGERLVCEGFEIRIIAVPREDNPERLRSLELPDWMADQFGVQPEARKTT
jgi:4-hydroxybenzoyl-CoA thioesterase